MKRTAEVEGSLTQDQRHEKGMDESWSVHAMMAAVMPRPRHLRRPEVLPQAAGNQRILGGLLGLAKAPSAGGGPRPEIVSCSHHPHNEA
jgi:hypothetical protein